MLKPGELFERYEVVSLLGVGGMGEVYQASDTRLGRTVALKVLKAGLDSQRLLREARATAALQHPNAVAIFDIGEEAERPFLVMELLQGATLSERAKDPTLTLHQKMRWIMQIGAALAAAHDVEVVHRDVKPENILITTDGVAKVLDFGLARAFHDPAERSEDTRSLGTLTAYKPHAMSPGTPMYMAPEQFKGGSIDGRADQFALALVAYELVSGSLPWAAVDNLASLAAHVLMTPAPPLGDKVAGLPRGLERAILQALSKEPAQRFESMHDFVMAIGLSMPDTDPLGATQIPIALGETIGAPSAISSVMPSARHDEPGFGADAFLAELTRAVVANEMYWDADNREVEAYMAHRIFDVADATGLHCTAKECKFPGRIGPLSARARIAEHVLKKDRHTFSLFRAWEEYSLPVALIEEISGESLNEFLDDMWDLLLGFARLRVGLCIAESDEMISALIARLRTEAVDSGWQYPGVTDDVLVIGANDSSPYVWQLFVRYAGSSDWTQLPNPIPIRLTEAE